MAPSKHPKSGRTLGLLTVIVVALIAGMFGTGMFTPRLGLDLSGGTTVTLTPVTQAGETPPDENIEEAVEIIRQRVNALGVSEAEVTRQSENIVVSVPGEGQRGIVQQVGQTAQLRFRQVLMSQPAGAAPQPSPTSPSPTSQSPEEGEGSGDAADSEGSGGDGGEGDSASGAAFGEDHAPSRSRAVSQALWTDSGAQSGSQPGYRVQQVQQDQPGQQGQQGGQSLSPEQRQQLLEQLQQQRQGQGQQPQQDTSGINEEVLQRFQGFSCEQGASAGRLLPEQQQVVACNEDGTAKYVLGKAEVLGTAVADANARPPNAQQGQSSWIVELNFTGQGTEKWADLTGRVTDLQSPRDQVAIVLDGEVVSAPAIQSAIPGGSAQIEGNFNQQSAEDLANVLRYGALPLKFEKSEIRQVSPTLGADQLRAGLIAGGLGLVLVLFYGLLYYRGLGFVIASSLVIAAGISYSAVVLLGITMGYRLSLAGVAGLIVSIGITADSFVVYFERLRDEVREGHSLRPAVERGWERARRTVLSADAVQFLAAAVLWILAVGNVKGFAFTLGLTTLIDVLVVFMFTKPMLSLLARTRFFGGGHPLSGLDPRRLGVRPDRTAAPRRATTTPGEA